MKLFLNKFCKTALAFAVTEPSCFATHTNIRQSVTSSTIQYGYNAFFIVDSLCSVCAWMILYCNDNRWLWGLSGVLVALLTLCTL